MKLVYPAIFMPCEESSGYTVEVPDLPGCVTEGRTLAEAIEMGQDAACGWILDELEDGNDYPSPSDCKMIHAPSDGFVNLLVLDMDSYIEKYGTETNQEKKNITLPA